MNALLSTITELHSNKWDFLTYKLDVFFTPKGCVELSKLDGNLAALQWSSAGRKCKDYIGWYFSFVFCFIIDNVNSTQHLCAMLIFKGGRLSHSMRVACQTLSVSLSERFGKYIYPLLFIYLFINLFIFIKLQLFVLKAHTPGPSCSTNDSTIYWLNKYLMDMSFG